MTHVRKAGFCVLGVADVLLTWLGARFFRTLGRHWPDPDMSAELDGGDGGVLHEHSASTCAALGCKSDGDSWFSHASGPFHVVVPLCALHEVQLAAGEPVEYVLVLHGTALTVS